MSAFEEKELNKVADALAALTPRPAHLDRDGLLFEAGRRSVRPGRFWPIATLAAGVVACVLLVALVIGPEPTTVVRWIQLDQPPTGTPQTIVAPAPSGAALEFEEAPLPPGSYWHLQQSALRNGIERMPMADPDVAATPPRPRDPIPSVGSRDMATTLLLTGDR